MSQAVVVGANCSLSTSNSYGSMYSHAMGDFYSMQVVTGEADVTVSLMFLIDGAKTYSTIVVNSTVHTQPIPVGSTYFEFNIQKAMVTGENALFNMQVFQNN